jgi:hypothetical protein
MACAPVSVSVAEADPPIAALAVPLLPPPSPPLAVLVPRK